MSAERRMAPTYPPSGGAASVRDALRALRHAGATVAAGAPPLERRPVATEPPRLQPAAPLEERAVRVRHVAGAPEVGIAAFLDGIQESRVLARWPDGVPIIFGTVAAAIRRRVKRTLTGWHQDAVRAERSLFVPRAAIGAAAWDALASATSVHDTLHGETAAAWHPQELTARALSAVQRRREALEAACADLWCQHGDGPLFVDGGIAASGTAARSSLAIGVVKSHRTLYVDGDALAAVLGLRAGERTTMFTVASPRRASVASWYVRLREPQGHDALWGLVRVEVALDGASPERADLVSRWLLAERSPVALPDPRWGAMAYGVRLTEEYLRAVTR